MTKETAIKLFEQKEVRSLWSDEDEKWYFSIIDIISILTDQPTHQGARNYWKVLKSRLVKEGNETVTNCNRLKLLAEDGKMLSGPSPTLVLSLSKEANTPTKAAGSLCLSERTADSNSVANWKKIIVDK